MCCWCKFAIIHAEKNMFWLFGIVKKYPEKNRNTNLVHFVSCRFFLTTAYNLEQRSRWNWVMQRSLVLKLPLSEKRAALRYNGEKSRFRLLFSYLEILCPIITFVLLPIISSTETVSEQFWCELEKKCIGRARLRLRVKMASSSKYGMHCWLCRHTFP